MVLLCYLAHMDFRYAIVQVQNMAPRLWSYRDATLENIIETAVVSCPPWTDEALVKTPPTFPMREPLVHRSAVMSHKAYIGAAIFPNLVGDPIIIASCCGSSGSISSFGVEGILLFRSSAILLHSIFGDYLCRNIVCDPPHSNCYQF
jgi:hypothetical protein